MYAGTKRWLAAGHDAFDGSKELPPMAVLTAGALAGVATWGVCYPIDVIKSRAQKELGPTYTSYRALARSEVALPASSKSSARLRFRRPGLSAGLSVALFGGAIRDCACFFGVEATHRVVSMRIL